MVGVGKQLVKQATPLFADRSDLHGRIAAHHLELHVTAAQREGADRSFDAQHRLTGGVLHLKQRTEKRPALGDVPKQIAHVVADRQFL